MREEEEVFSITLKEMSLAMKLEANTMTVALLNDPSCLPSGPTSLAMLFQEIEVVAAPAPWNVRYGSVLGTCTFSLLQFIRTSEDS